MPSDITLVLTTVGEPRATLRRVALMSVVDQDRLPDDIVIATDTARAGAAVNRQAGTDRVTTEWVAYLDDDDLLYPQHLAALATTAEATGADLVYPWFDVIGGGSDPFPQFFGEPWNDEDPHQVPVTFLARTEALRAAGGWVDDWGTGTAEDPGTDADGNRAGEDWRLINRLIGVGAKIVHHPERTWGWNHWVQYGRVGNSCGLPSRIPWGTTS